MFKFFNKCTPHQRLPRPAAAEPYSKLSIGTDALGLVLTVAAVLLYYNTTGLCISFTTSAFVLVTPYENHVRRTVWFCIQCWSLRSTGCLG